MSLTERSRYEPIGFVGGGSGPGYPVYGPDPEPTPDVLVNISQLRVLGALYETGQLPVSGICRRVNFSAKRVRYTVAQLVRRGMVSFVERTDPQEYEINRSGRTEWDRYGDKSDLPSENLLNR